MRTCCAVLLTALLMLMSCGALAQALPSNDCFSPGLLALAQAVRAGDTVNAQAAFTVDNAFYARDLSVLSAMLDGLSIRYSGGEADGAHTDVLTLAREGEPLLLLGQTRDDSGTVVLLDGDAYALADELTPDAAWTALSKLDGVAIWERVPLESIAAWLTGLQTGDAVAFGFQVAQPFTVARTLSDDGTRLTRIDITGALARPGERAWTISGFLRQPAGRAPKDTFELTVQQDADNTFTLSYSALREQTVTRKDRAGEVTVQTTLQASGKLAGSRLSTRLTVRMQNAWTAQDTGALGERITLTAKLTHQDKTPGRRMQRLNDVDAESRHTLTLTSGETNALPSLTDEATLRVTMDSNTFLDGRMALRAQVGGEAPQMAASSGEPASAQTLREAFDRAVVRLAARLYDRVGERARQAIHKGL